MIFISFIEAKICFTNVTFVFQLPQKNLTWWKCFVSSSIVPLFRPVSKSLQVQSRHTLQVQDETLGSLCCCFGQDMSSSMSGCTAVRPRKGKRFSFTWQSLVTVTVFHREFNEAQRHQLLPVLHPPRLCLHWSKPNGNHCLRKWFRVVCVPFLQV